MPERLIGREAEIEGVLKPLVEKAVNGAKRAAVLLGPTGIGKTSLLRWTRDHAEERGALCSFVRVPAAAGLPPRFPIGEVLDGLAASCRARGLTPPDPLRRVLDTLRGATTAEEYPAALPQIAAALEATARLAPIAVFIDDLQWVPLSRRQILLSSMRTFEGSALFCATVRGSGKEGTPILEQSGDLVVEPVSLANLDERGVGLLAADVLGAPAVPSLVSLLSRATLGNPLFVTETLRLWAETKTVIRRGGYWAVRTAGATPEATSLSETMREGLALLSRAQLEVLCAVSLMGRPCTIVELGEMLHASDDDIVERTTTLTTRGLLQPTDPHDRAFRIAHPAFEPVVRSQIGPAGCAQLHGLIFEYLNSGGGASATELAHHALRSLRRPDGLDTLLKRAAEQASSVAAWEEAATWYAELEECAAASPNDVRWARERRATAAMTFQPRLSIDLLSQLIETSDVAGDRVRLLVARAAAFRVLGEFDESLQDLTCASQQAVGNERNEIQHRIAVLAGIRGDISAASEILHTLLVPARGTVLYPKVLGHLGQVSFVNGDLENAIELWQRAAEQSDDLEHRLHMLGNIAWGYVLTGCWSQAQHELDVCLRVATQSGDYWNENVLLCSAARLNAWQGNLADALDYANRAVTRAPRLENPICTVAALDALAVSLLEAGHAEDAWRVVADILKMNNNPLEARESALTLTVCADVAISVGDLTKAAELIRTARTEVRQARFLEPAIDRVAAQLALATGDPARALDFVTPWIDLPIVAFERGRVWEVAARAAQVMGDATRAIDCLRHAEQEYLRQGSTRRLSAVRERITDHVPRRRGRPISRAAAGLTVRELEIARLAAQGLTDSAIADALTLSRRTVNTHIERVKRKFGVSRRVELVAKVRALDE